MKKFIVKCIVFSVVLLLLLLKPSIYLFQTKEYFVSMEDLLETKKSLIGYKYNRDNIREYKLRKINLSEKLDILALGSSRILQFRKEMFNGSFYNAGFLIESISDFKLFLNCLDEAKYPETLIIGLDQWMFNKNWDDLKSKKTETYWTKSFTFYPPANVIVENLLQNKFELNNKEFISQNKIGLKAINFNSGYREDGSRSYGKQIDLLLENDNSLEDFEYRDTFKRIEEGNKRFEYSDHINIKAIFELDELLKYCNSKNIEVIAFLPPFAKGVVDKMNSSGNYKYLFSLYNEIKPIFVKYNFEVYDYTDPLILNSVEGEFVDGFHGGESVYLRIIKDMLIKKSKLNIYTSKEKLENDVNKKLNRYVVY